MSRYKITVEYDGTPFFGWQKQRGLPTIQSALEEAILPLTKSPVTIFGAGRTDTGVHALEQVAHFDANIQSDCNKIRECMNARMKNIPVRVLHVEKVSNEFDARFSAIERGYLYKILNRRAGPTLDKNRCWHVMKDLDVDKMNAAAQILLGQHDFSAFRAAGCQALSPIKTLNYISVLRNQDIITIDVRAKSFLYHQVRNIVGSLFMVGCGKWSEKDFQNVLEGKNRAAAGQTAPPEGLYFAFVKY